MEPQLVTELSFSRKNLLTVRSQIHRHAQSLQSLDLSKTRIADLSSTIASLPKLKKLKCSENELKRLELSAPKDSGGHSLYPQPPTLVVPQSLVVLDLSGNLLDYLSKGWSQMQSLIRLDLGFNMLSYLPDDFGQLNNLQDLILSANNFSVFPAQLTQLKQLTSLEFAWQYAEQRTDCIAQEERAPSVRGSLRLSVLPPAIAMLKHLEHLDLSDNDLTELPDGFGQLENLRVLTLADNRLCNIPDDFGQLNKLQSLDMSSNCFTVFPAQLVKLKQLTFLALAWQQLSNSMLSMLQRGGTGLSILPPAIAGLEQLEHLDLRDNLLTELPDGIGQLEHLRVLNLADNRLTKLPMSMKYLTKLITLNVEGNPLRSPPAEVCCRGAQAVVDYLRELKHSAQPCRLLKLVFIGDALAGKTMLFKALREGQAVQVDHTPEQQGALRTVGIAREWWLPVAEPTGNGVVPYFDVLDCGGQEGYHVMHQLFFTRRSLFVLVMDLSRSEAERQEQLSFWVKAVFARVPGARFVIVGSKLDQRVAQAAEMEALADTLRNDLYQQVQGVGTSIARVADGFRQVFRSRKRSGTDEKRVVALCDELPRLPAGPADIHVVSVKKGFFFGVGGLLKHIMSEAVTAFQLETMIPASYFWLMEEVQLRTQHLRQQRQQSTSNSAQGQQSFYSWSDLQLEFFIPGTSPFSKHCGWKQCLPCFVPIKKTLDPGVRPGVNPGYMFDSLSSFQHAVNFLEDLGQVMISRRSQENDDWTGAIIFIEPYLVVEAFKYIVHHDLGTLCNDNSKVDTSEWKSTLVQMHREALEEEGILWRDLLPALWRKSFPEIVHPALLVLLQQLGMLFEWSTSPELFAVPSRWKVLQGQVKVSAIGMHDPPSGSYGAARHGWCITFLEHMPPVGLYEYLIASCACEVQKNGPLRIAKIYESDARRKCLTMEVDQFFISFETSFAGEHYIEITAYTTRADVQVMDKLRPVLEKATELLSLYSGSSCLRRALCPHPKHAAHEDPLLRPWRVDQLEPYAAKLNATVLCSTCNQYVLVCELVPPRERAEGPTLHSAEPFIDYMNLSELKPSPCLFEVVKEPGSVGKTCTVHLLCEYCLKRPAGHTGYQLQELKPWASALLTSLSVIGAAAGLLQSIPVPPVAIAGAAAGTLSLLVDILVRKFTGQPNLSELHTRFNTMSEIMKTQLPATQQAQLHSQVQAGGVDPELFHKASELLKSVENSALHQHDQWRDHLFRCSLKVQAKGQPYYIPVFVDKECFKVLREEMLGGT
eukprot:jgi/Chlat1/324/Chrsp1S03075